MKTIADLRPRDGCQDKAERMYRRINATVYGEKACWPWQRRRRQLLRERRVMLVRALMDCYDLPAGDLVKVPTGWLA